METLSHKIVDLVSSVETLHNSVSRVSYIRLMLKLYEIMELLTTTPLSVLLPGKDVFYGKIRRTRQTRMALVLQTYVDEDSDA